MKIQIGKRQAFYCNVKAVLLFLVIYGHLIEARIEDSDLLLWQYRLIYAVHMPMFAFVSGMFLKTKQACVRQMKASLKYYVLCQTVYVAVTLVTGTGQPSFLIPCWHLWYLLSMFWWALVCLAVGNTKKPLVQTAVMFFSIVLACLCGNWNSIGRVISLSRTLCFLPYVLLGRRLPVDLNFSGIRWICVGLGGFCVGVYCIIASIVPVEFFYHAASYETIQISNGAVFRLMSYGIALGIGAFLFSVIPSGRFEISKAGSDTLFVYLLHGPVVKLLQKIEIGTELFVVVAPVAAFAIYVLLYELGRWNSKWCRIT